MRIPLTLAVVLALSLGVGTAGAEHGDPRKQISRADQARARSMLLQRADLTAGFKATRSSSNEPHLYCKALDESDLTVTGDAESPDFERGVVFISSAASVYRSTADANASWQRGTSAAGERCSRDLLRREFAKDGIKLVSMRRVAFPRVSSQTAAYRIVLSTEVQGTAVPVVLDLVVLMHSRAQVALFFGSGFVAVPRADEVRLARLTAKRLATAMRGS